jgi:hypothetical protein
MSRDNRPQGGGYSRESYDNLPAEAEEKKPEPEKSAPEVDLMDMSGWDAPAPAPANPSSVNIAYGQQPPQYNSQSQQNFAPVQHSEQQFQQQQQMTPGYSNALVPSVQQQAYPGTPATLQQQYPAQHQSHNPYDSAMVPVTHGQPYAGAPSMIGQPYDTQPGWIPPGQQQQQPPQNPWMTTPQQQFTYAPTGPTSNY